HGINKFELQGAFSPKQNLGIQVNSFLSPSINYAEIMVGHYHPFNDLFVWNIYGGAGYGNINKSIIYQDNIGFNTAKSYKTKIVDCQYSRYALQMGIAYVSDWIKLGVSVRGSYAHYYNYEYYDKTTYWDDRDPSNQQIETIQMSINKDNLDLFTITPCFHFEAGTPHFAGIIKIGQSIPLYGYQFETPRYPRTNPFIFTTGVRLSPRFRKKDRD
ncbi:MAG: hypothetical protein JKY42_09950, partial [Flavobacteriales bacterium]|nr:hypothetical protein [Flavobacteriales bacterium]